MTAYLGVDFSAKGDVSYYIYNNGQAYAPTIVHSNAKDGSFESCVQDVILRTKFPVVQVDTAVPVAVPLQGRHYRHQRARAVTR